MWKAAHESGVWGMKFWRGSRVLMSGIAMDPGTAESWSFRAFAVNGQGKGLCWLFVFVRVCVRVFVGLLLTNRSSSLAQGTRKRKEANGGSQ